MSNEMLTAFAQASNLNPQSLRLFIKSMIGVTGIFASAYCVLAMLTHAVRQELSIEGLFVYVVRVVIWVSLLMLVIVY